jgi:aminoglycoside phosphotransferase (APT) family kinase protein
MGDAALDSSKGSEQLSAAFLHAAIVALRQNVLPAVTTQGARIHLDLVTRILYLLEYRFSQRASDLELLVAEEGQLLACMASVLDHKSEPATARIAAAEAHPSSMERVEAARYAEELALSSRIPALMREALGDSSRKGSSVQILREIMLMQERFLLKQYPDISGGSYICYQGGVIDHERSTERPAILGREVDAESLTGHFQTKNPGVRVESVSAVAGGFSKSTYFATLMHPAGGSEAIVIRKDLPVSFISSVEQEYPLLRQLFARNFPVAEPLWLESDPTPFGGRFLVSRRVGGSTDVARWIEDKPAVEKFARQLAQVMARLHRLPPTQLGFEQSRASRSAGELMQEEIQRWYGVFLCERREVFPLQEISMSWLKSSIPATLFSRHASLVHGDIGFHNLMIDAGQVTALLDWEFAHLGDPIEDLVYTKPFMERVMDWERFKGFYYEYGGPQCSEEEEFFYTVWSKTRNPAATLRAGSVFEALPNEVKFAVSGFVLGQYIELEATRMVLDALAT